MPDIKLTPMELQEMLREMLRENQGGTLEALKAFAQELKKPTEEEARKLAQEREIRERRARESVELAKVELESKRQRQLSCRHRKEDGTHTVRGQIHGDGYVHPICIRCFTEFKPFRPAAEMLTGGVNLGGYFFSDNELERMTKEVVQ